MWDENRDLQVIDASAASQLFPAGGTSVSRQK